MPKLVASPKEEKVARVHLFSVELLGQGRAGDGAENDGQEGAEFDDAVAPGEAFYREQFGEQAVFGGAEKSGLGRDQSQRGEGDRQPVRGEASGGDEHRGDFHRLGEDGDLAFAEPVREPAAGHAEEDEGNGKQQRGHGDEALALIFAEAHADDDGEQQITQDVIAECALKLGDDEGPESAGAADGFGGSCGDVGGGCFRCGHREMGLLRAAEL